MLKVVVFNFLLKIRSGEVSHILFFLALALQKLLHSTSTRSPAVCSTSAGSSLLQPCLVRLFHQSTARYTPPLPPPRPPPRPRPLRPSYHTCWQIRQLRRRPRARPRLSTIACSSLKACLSTWAKVSTSSQNRNVPDLWQDRCDIASFLPSTSWCIMYPVNYPYTLFNTGCWSLFSLLVCVVMAASALTLLSVRWSFRWSVSGLSPDSQWHTR